MPRLIFGIIIFIVALVTGWANILALLGGIFLCVRAFLRAMRGPFQNSMATQTYVTPFWAFFRFFK